MKNVSIIDVFAVAVIYGIAVPVLAVIALLAGFVLCFLVGPIPVYKFFKASFFTDLDKQVLC